MAILLYTLEGWPSSPSSDNVARSFNNDALTWSTAIAAPPFTGQVVSTNPAVRQRGAWDGSKWYVIGPDGKLYAYTPGANTWSAALAGGAAIIGGTVEDQHWTMASDGRFVYILDSNAGFRRYDPSGNTLNAMASIPGNFAGAKMLLDYDGVDTLYGFRGGSDNPHQLSKYTLSSGVWTVLPSQATINTDLVNNFSTWSAYLGGAWWLFYFSSGSNATKVWKYDPGGNTWTAKTTLSASLNITGGSPYGERTDTAVRLWPSTSTDATADYNTATDTWTRDTVPPVTFNQGGNWAVSRLYTLGYSYYEADGVTPLNPTKNLQGVAVGGTITYQIKVKATGAVGGGASVTVPSQINTDAEDVVTICGTVGGTYGTAFVTAALTAGQTFDVFIKVVPTTAQSLGLAKLWNLRVV